MYDGGGTVPLGIDRDSRLARVLPSEPEPETSPARQLDNDRPPLASSGSNSISTAAVSTATAEVPATLKFPPSLRLPAATPSATPSAPRGGNKFDLEMLSRMCQEESGPFDGDRLRNFLQAIDTEKQGILMENDPNHKDGHRTLLHTLCANPNLKSSMIGDIQKSLGPDKSSDCWFKDDHESIGPIQKLIECERQDTEQADLLAAVDIELKESRPDWLRGKNKRGLTVLHMICENLSLGMKTMEAVAKMTTQSAQGAAWEQLNENQMTPLHCLCRNEAALERQCLENIGDGAVRAWAGIDSHCQTPLHMLAATKAVAKSNCVLKQLEKVTDFEVWFEESAPSKCSVNFWQPDKNGKTPLSILCENTELTHHTFRWVAQERMKGFTSAWEPAMHGLCHNDKVCAKMLKALKASVVPLVENRFVGSIELVAHQSAVCAAVVLRRVQAF
jgi:hypothetical protein